MLTAAERRDYRVRSIAIADIDGDGCPALEQSRDGGTPEPPRRTSDDGNAAGKISERFGRWLSQERARESGAPNICKLGVSG